MPLQWWNFVTIVSEIMKVYGPTEIQNPTYCLRNRTTEAIYLRIKNSWQKYTEKMKNDPLNEYFFLIV